MSLLRSLQGEVLDCQEGRRVELSHGEKLASLVVIRSSKFVLGPYFEVQHSMTGLRST